MRFVLLLAASTLSAFAPNLNPVKWTLTHQPGKLILHASIAEHYKLYSLTKPKPGPIPLEIKIRETNWVPRIRPIQPDPAHTFEGEVDFEIPLKLSRPIPPKGLTLHLDIRYQSCSDQICLPPVRRNLQVELRPAP